MPSEPTRRVLLEDALTVLQIVRSGDLSREEGMRLLFPEDAAKIYNPGRWPFGPPKE